MRAQRFVLPEASGYGLHGTNGLVERELQEDPADRSRLGATVTTPITQRLHPLYMVPPTVSVPYYEWAVRRRGGFIAR